MVALGRLVEHDPRSREYPARKAVQPRSVMWVHTAPVLDQGDIGACTGFALTQCLNTANFVRSRPKRLYLTAEKAQNLYSAATHVDSIPGVWPPTDTGSSGLAVCKAAVQMGYLGAYRHAFGFQHFIEALSVGPVIVGTDWHQDMFTVDRRNMVHPTGGIVGGHEYVALGLNLRSQTVTFLNSWGPKWGGNGRFQMEFQAFAQLLAAQGDVTVPVGKP